MMKLVKNYRLFIVGLAMLLSHNVSATLMAQNSNGWLGKESAKELDDIEKWQEVQRQYDASVAEKDSLSNVVKTLERNKGSLLNKQKALQNQLSGMQIDEKGKRKPISQMYTMYDTTILILHQGQYGDSSTENLQNALLVCHRAELVLVSKYNKKSVEEAIKTVGKVSRYLPKESEELMHRLEQYGVMNANLHTALDSANAKPCRPDPDPDRSSHMTKKFTERFFSELEKRINPAILSQTQYPYLYNVLQEAMTEKIIDPSNDIKDIIDKL